MIPLSPRSAPSLSARPRPPIVPSLSSPLSARQEAVEPNPIVVRGRAAGESTISAPRQESNSTTKWQTALLVEDDDCVRGLLCRILHKLGFHVLEAGYGRKAMREANDCAGTIDLLIADLNLPILNGLEVARRTSQLHPQCKVLLVTGGPDDALDAAEKEGPHFSLLQKPFTAGVFSDHVNAIMGRG